jgi:hypothetical protein
MALIDELIPTKKLPFSGDYKEEQEAISFYNISYESSGTDYTLGDAPDGSIIHRLECELPQDYRMRCKQTPTRSYVASIINKYNSSVFRNEPSRDTSNYEELYSNADGYNTSLNELMKKALLASQIDGASYLLVESDGTTEETKTVAQQNSLDTRSYIRLIKSESVVNYEEIEEKIISAVVLLEDANGVTFARYMDDVNYIDIKINTNYMIQEVTEPYPHGLSSIPLVEIEPNEQPQSKSISYSQRNIVNLLSLLQQEITDNVFTKFVISNVRVPKDDTNSETKVTWGSKRLTILEDQATIQQLGADAGCADSLRKQIEMEEANLYYSAGFGKNNTPDASQNISGLALLISREDFFIICNALKTAIEQAEIKVMSLIAEKEQWDYAPVVYSSKYVADDNGDSLLKLRDLLALNMPATFKKLAIKNYIETFYNLSSSDKLKIEEELNNPQ